MLWGELGFFCALYAFLLFALLRQTHSMLHLLLTAELAWITLFCMALVAGFSGNDHNLVALTFYFLLFSAVEFSVGLVLLVLQNIWLRTAAADGAAAPLLPRQRRVNSARTFLRTQWQL